MKSIMKSLYEIIKFNTDNKRIIFTRRNFGWGVLTFLTKTFVTRTNFE